MRSAVWFMLAVTAACSAPAAPEKTRPPPLVTTTKVSVEDVPVLVKGPVDLRPIASADVGSKTVGYLDSVLVDRGDVVKKGQLLALVRPSDLPEQLSTGKSAVAQAEAARNLAKANLERAQRLAPTGLLSQQDLQNAMMAASASEASLAAAQSQVTGVAVRLGETRLEAPYDGVVTGRRLDPGALVGPTTGAVLTVAKIETLRAFLAATEAQAVHLQLGQPARVWVSGLDEPAVGRVQRLAPAFDPVTRTLDAEIYLPNESGRLHPGMYGRGEIEIDVKKGALVVPVESVQLAGAKAFVFVAQGDTVKRTEVTLGEDLGDRLEIAKGLDPSAEIVVRGIDSLSDGAKIRRAGQGKDASPAAAAATR